MLSPAKRRNGRRAATLADVGKAAGVSAMAASVVLNGARTSSRISPETRHKILAAAAHLRYRPNVAARSLANRCMNTIGVAAMFEGSELNLYFLEALNGILEGAARHGQNTTVFSVHHWTNDLSRFSGFCDGRIDGLILLAPLLTKEEARLLPDHTPFVALHPNERFPGITTIESDEETGAFEMVSHLISLGHRRIMHISGPVSMLGAKRRIRGYERALAKAKIPCEPELLVEADFSGVAGRLALESWLSANVGKVMPQAIFAANDSIALGCLEALTNRGLRVPEDISICGFDDTLGARTTLPKLTTMRQPLRQMGNRAVDILLGQIQLVHENQQSVLRTGKPVVFPTELVIRDSVGAPCPRRIIPGPLVC